MITSEIPWWAKIAAKVVLSRLPFKYAGWQRLGLFRHGSMDTTEYAIKVFDGHVQRAGLTGKLNGKTLLELGPGDSAATAVIAAAHGARAVLIDTGAFARADLKPYLHLHETLAQQGLTSPDLTACENLRDVLEACGASYWTEGCSSFWSLADESVDLIFSQAVLEHVREGAFWDTILQSKRVLSPGGLCSHRVDLRDHLAGGLNNLRFGSRIWESDFLANSGFYTNRIRHGQMLELFHRAGFETEILHVRRWETLPIKRKRLSSEFRKLPEDEYLVYGFDVLLRPMREKEIVADTDDAY